MAAFRTPLIRQPDVARAHRYLAHVPADLALWPWARVDAPRWVASLSPFAHLAAVPAELPDWPGTFAMLAVAAVVTAAGLWAYERRDLRLT
jgi:putative exporter of polyketide antibiotics